MFHRCSTQFSEYWFSFWSKKKKKSADTILACLSSTVWCKFGFMKIMPFLESYPLQVYESLFLPLRLATHTHTHTRSDRSSLTFFPSARVSEPCLLGGCSPRIQHGCGGRNSSSFTSSCSLPIKVLTWHVAVSLMKACGSHVLQILHI